VDGAACAQVATPDEASAGLQEMGAYLRRCGPHHQSSHDACADLLALYADTRTWCAAERSHKGAQPAPSPVPP